jgi:hypothetical protein
MRPSKRSHEAASAASIRRIFIGPVNTASYYSGLKQGFDALGIPAVHICFSIHPFHRLDPNGNRGFFLRTFDTIACWKSNRQPADRLKRLLAKLLFPVLKCLIFAWAIVACDVFLFGAGKSFYGLRELPLLRLLGKKIIFVFNGSDSRPYYLNGLSALESSPVTLDQCKQKAARQKRKIRKIEQYADICINHPPQGHFHEKPFINHCWIGHPCSLEGGRRPAPRNEAEQTVRIVHAPSKSSLKGTRHVRQAIDALKHQGYQIDYIEISGRPNSEVLEELSKCDFVIDQVFADIPMAALSTEAALFSKPSIVGGYAHDELNRYAGNIGLPMATYAKPEELESMVRRLIDDPEFRRECGARAHDFVRSYWRPQAVAARVLALLQGAVPREWWYDPYSLAYLEGLGTSRSRLRSFLREYLDSCGEDALQLADKPMLRLRLLEFASKKETELRGGSTRRAG